MPFPLFSIPVHISISIIQKFDLLDFVNFHQCSLKSFKASKNVKKRFTIENPIRTGTDGTPLRDPIQLDFKYSDQKLMVKFYKSNKSFLSYWERPFREDLCHFPIRFENGAVRVNGELTEDYCISLVYFIKNTYSMLDKIDFSKIGCSPNALKQLVETQKVQEMWFRQPLSPVFMTIEAIKNRSVFEIDNFIEEAEILLLDAVNCHIKSSNITSSGINQILKEILDDKRKIIKILIVTEQELEKRNIFQGIESVKILNHMVADVVSVGGLTYRVYYTDYCNNRIKIVKYPQ